MVATPNTQRWYRCWLKSGAGPYYDSSSTQANDDDGNGGSTLIKVDDRTLVKDDGSIEGSAPNNQQTQQGDNNFNNQQYYSKVICIICRYIDTINDYNILIAEFQKLYEQTPTTNHFIRTRIQSGLKNQKETCKDSSRI